MTAAIRSSAGRTVAAALIVAVPLAPAVAKDKEDQVAAPAEPLVTDAPAEDGNIRIVVDEVIAPGAPGYLPKNKNWLQLHVTITNKGSSIIGFTDLRERLSNGTVVEPAKSIAELKKPPNFTGSAGKQLGLGTAGHMAGMFIAPPLALAAGVASLFGNTLGLDKKAKRDAKLQRSMLNATPIAPGTSVAGAVYLPALRDHNGLIAFYSADEKLRSLALQRTDAAAPPPPPAAMAAPAPAPAPAAAQPARKAAVRR